MATQLASVHVQYLQPSPAATVERKMKGAESQETPKRKRNILNDFLTRDNFLTFSCRCKCCRHLCAAGALRRASALFPARHQRDLLPSVALASLLEKVSG